MKEPQKSIIITIAVAVVLVILVMLLLPLVPLLPAWVGQLLMVAIVLLAAFRIFTLLGWW